MQRFDLKKFIALATAPAEHCDPWFLNAADAIQFISSNSESEELIIFASAPAVYMVAALTPTTNVNPVDVDSLRTTSLTTDATWRIQRSWSGIEGHRVYLEPPFPEEDGSPLSLGEPLIFCRFLEGVHKSRPPIEISQKLIHCLDIHFLPERNAYSRLDENGDIEDVIRIRKFRLANEQEDCEIVTISRKDLDTYMAVAGMAPLLKFDFTRFVSGDFHGWEYEKNYERNEGEIYYHGGEAGNASFVNGTTVIRSQTTIEDQENTWRKTFGEDPDREYACFKIFDRKNDCNVETSASPRHIVSYFEDSPLPWHISPAFFRAEVLHRFKADPEKFDLEDRSISCRGAWHIKSYDINEAGQVHVYIGDLAKLPIGEQNYWKAFNEWPKASISARAHQTDIEGSWDTQPDPINTLKVMIRALDAAKPEWWNYRGESLSDSVLAPATDSPKEWGDEIMALDQLLIEGFLDKPLRKIAEGEGCKLEPSWRSLKILHEILAISLSNGDSATQLLAPMKKLHNLRNEIKGHATGEKKDIAIREARTNHGNFRTHFFDLVEGCNKSLAAIFSALNFDFRA